jgi:NADH-quinone oxidoreductase subunit H
MEFLIAAIKVIAVPLIVLNLIPLLIWMERKGAAYIQDRRGPNRANILGIRLGGMIHNLADVVKLITKEEFFPAGANRFYFVLAPFLTMFIYFVTTAVIPFADTLHIGDRTLSLQAVDLNVGVLYIFSMSSLAVYGIMLAGWSSANKYSLLGALRASSQMISYEIALGLAVVSLFMLSGSVDLNAIVRNQTAAPWDWNIVRQPLAFLLFLVASFAECNRTPFDLPEGESELVAGYHVEYSSMKFALFFMGEYAAIIVSSAVIVSLFVGGWQVPFLGTEDLIVGADFYFRLLGTAFGILSALAGLLMISKFKKGFYKDARDYEVLVLGIPAVVVGAALVWFFFFHGFPPLPAWGAAVFAAAVQFVFFLAKTLFFCFFFIWVRWTLPRFRYDQLMGFGWKGMLPLALFNVIATGIYLLLWS